MIRPFRPWRSPLQARDLRDETPWAALPPSCLPCSLPSLPPCSHGAPRAVTATTPRSAWRQRGARAHPPLFGGRSGNANSNAPERAQVQSDLASRPTFLRAIQRPVRTRLLEGSAVRFLLAPPRSLCDPAALRARGNSSLFPPLRRGSLGQRASLPRETLPREVVGGAKARRKMARSQPNEP